MGGFRGEKEAILKATSSTLALKETRDLSEIIGDVLCSPQYSMKYLNTHPHLAVNRRIRTSRCNCC